MPKHPGGRPTTYTDEIANEICERIMNGESLRTITKDDDMPERKTIHNWLSVNEEFLHQYKEARDIQADTYTDEMEDIARDPTIDVQRARLIVDTRKWVASKLKPKKYGDKLDLDANLTGKLTIETIDYSNAEDTDTV